MESNLKRTPLFEDHVKLGGKMVPFAGWEMPVQYSGVIAEHAAVRSAAGLFDVSHMGEIELKGPEAEKALAYMTVNDVTKLTDGKAQYSAISNEQGGLVDDIIIYRYSSTHYLICVNASNTDKDFEWFRSKNKFNAEFKNISSDWGQIALQGPKALAIFEKALGSKCDIELFYFGHRKIAGVEVIVARTGYTGEDGVELFVPWDKTATIWNHLLSIGKADGLVPCGLGARDTLRLEACLPLYGHELGDTVSPIESGIGFFVKVTERDFIGKSTIKNHKENGAPRSLVSFFVQDPGIVREGAKMFAQDGKEIGWVTSGTKTPNFEKPLGLAIVSSQFSGVGSEIFADVRGRKIRCQITKRPFYKRNY
jgi:aminomethyltransferase